MASLVTKNLKLQIAQRTLCESLSFEICTGQTWAILGKNGAGKTTLLHSLAGLNKQQLDNNKASAITINGQAIQDINRQQLAQQLGMLLQDFQDVFPATVLDTALIGRHPHLKAWQWPDNKDIDFVKHLLKQMGLAGYEQRDITSLSGGERRRLGLVTLLGQQTEILLLDEPVNHLDIAHQHQLLKYITAEEFKQEHAVAMVLHDINLAKQYCDHVLFIYDDGITQAGTAEDMLNAENLTEVYGYPISKITTDNKTVFTTN